MYLTRTRFPGNATPYDDLFPVNLTNQQEAHKSAISYAQHHTQDHILTEFHNISRGMVILKGEMKKMDMRYNELEKMRDSLAGQLEALGLEVCEAQNIKRTLQPSQETQTQMQDIIEQQATVTSITTPVQAPPTATTAPVQPITNPDVYTLPQDLHFIQTKGKLNTQYHTDDYILTIQQSSTSDRILSIGQKSAAVSNEPMTQLTAQEILDILNAPPETPTSLQTLPGTDMIASTNKFSTHRTTAKYFRTRSIPCWNTTTTNTSYTSILEHMHMIS